MDRIPSHNPRLCTGKYSTYHRIANYMLPNIGSWTPCRIYRSFLMALATTAHNIFLLCPDEDPMENNSNGSLDQYIHLFPLHMHNTPSLFSLDRMLLVPKFMDIFSPDHYCRLQHKYSYSNFQLFFKASVRADTNPDWGYNLDFHSWIFLNPDYQPLCRCLKLGRI